MQARYHLTSHRKYDARRLARFVANVRRRRGTGISALAAQAGMEAGRLADVEAGVAVLTEGELASLAVALSLSETVLLEEAGLLSHYHTGRRLSRNDGQPADGGSGRA